MTMKHSDRDPSRKRAVAVAELGVLLGLGALVVLAIIVGQSVDDAADIAPGVGPAPEHEGAVNVGVADTTPSTTAPSASRVEPTTSDVSPVLETAGTAMNPPETLSADNETVRHVTPTTEPPASSVKPETTIPNPDVTALGAGITALVEGPFVQVDIGGPYGCGLLENGHLKCWGRGPVPASAPQNLQFLTIDADSYSACAVRAEGGLHCWGPSGALDLGDDIAPYTSVALESRVLCALRFDERILCSASEMNPDSHTISRDGFKAVVGGGGAFCALEASGTVSCWEEYFNVEMRELPGFRLLSQVEPPDGPFQAIYMNADGFYACAIRTDDSAACWGYIDIDLAGQVSELALGRHHACGLRLSGEVICGGWDHWGQANAPDGVFGDISAGSRHSCGLRTTGELVCWGNSDHNQISVPVGRFIAVQSKAHRNCAIRSDGAAVCWGQPF